MKKVIGILQTEAKRALTIIDDLMDHYERFTVAKGDLEEIQEALGPEKTHLEWVSSPTYGYMLLKLTDVFHEVFNGYDVEYSIDNKKYTTLDIDENVDDDEEGIEPSSFMVTVKYNNENRRHAQFKVYVDHPYEGNRCFRISLFGDIEPEFWDIEPDCEEFDLDEANIDCETYVCMDDPRMCYKTPRGRVRTSLVKTLESMFDKARKI